MQIINDPRPWTGGVDRSLSIVDLMAAGTIPAAEAATLWWALERGASLFTAGGPSGAGKSTLANALLAFLPDGARMWVSSGRQDQFAIPDADGPTYLLVSELSDHGRPFYLSGPAALRAFSLLGEGKRIIGTLHAERVTEAVSVMRDEMGVPAGDVARVTLVAVIHVDGPRNARGGVDRDRPDLERRVVEIGLLSPDSGGVGVTPIAAWNQSLGRLETAPPPAGLASLAAWAGLERAPVEAAIRARAEALSTLLAQGRRDQEHILAEVNRLRQQPAT
jgi:hypothetical protein